MPLGEYMQSVLKSNKSIRRAKKNRFKDNDTSITKGVLDFSHLPKATPHEIDNLKKMLKKEQKTRLTKQVVLFLVIVLIIISLLYYL